MVRRPTRPFRPALLCLLLALPLAAGAQPERGTARVTPHVPTELMRVPVHVPPAFAHLPDTLSLNLPPGFRASVYAAFESVRRPRFMAFDAAGVLHVANMDDDEIIALPDRDGDGVADEAIVAASGFSRPHSIAFHDGALYVGDRPQILRFRDTDGDLVYEEREVLVDNIPASGSHSTRTLVIDAERGKMYLGVGWPCDLCRVSDPERGTILEFNLDGSGRRVFAEGVRNVIGMDLHPVTGQLWGTNNGHDLEGIDAPPEWIDILRDGGFYGIPLAYGFGKWADFTIPAYRDNILPLTAADSAKVARMQRPAALVPSHTAPMDIHFYTQERFPARYRNAAFVALHAGHAKLAPIEGYSVIALFVEPDGSDARVEDFVTGFQTGTEIEDVWGYPMGLATDTEGRLYLSSDLGNRLILRIDHSPIVAEAALGLPDSTVDGAVLPIDGVVHLHRVAPGDGTPVVTADLSELGGPAAVPLTPEAPGRFRLRTTVSVAAEGGLRRARVTVRQPTGAGEEVVELAQTIAVQPRRPRPELVLFDEELAPGWRVLHKTWLEDRGVDMAEDGTVHTGERSMRVRVNRGDWDWVVRFKPERPVDPMGFGTLHFAFHAGPFDREPTEDFNLYAAGTLVDLVEEGYVDITSKEWQVVEVPLSAFGPAQPLQEITFGGDFSRTIYLDDVRLQPAPPPATAVEGVHATPETFALEASYPNPFNSSVIIPFRIAVGGPVELTVHNLAGQRVASLVDEARGAGAHQVRWNGVDDGGRALATGIYFARLQAGDVVQTRKLLLLR